MPCFRRPLEVEMSFLGLITSPFSQSQQTLPPLQRNADATPPANPPSLWSACRMNSPSRPKKRKQVHLISSAFVYNVWRVVRMKELKRHCPQVTFVLAFKAKRGEANSCYYSIQVPQLALVLATSNMFPSDAYSGFLATLPCSIFEQRCHF